VLGTSTGLGAFAAQVIVVSAVWVVGCLDAQAGPAAVGPRSEKPAGVANRVADAEAGSSVEVPEEQPLFCKLGRKRLWVEGEGWMVRRVRPCF
jgi:hypothetical protein